MDSPSSIKREAPRRVTIRDIAQAAGVSKSLVSLVLNGSDLVRPQTRARVVEAMRALGYVYNRGAARLRAGGGNAIIGMVINDLANPFYTELAIGIERACQSADVVPFIANTAESAVRQAQVIRSMREYGAAGLVLAPAMDTDPAQLDALTGNLPVVFAMRWLRGARGSAVVPDNRAGARAATAHLLALGHRRIAFLGGIPGMLVRSEREAGYRDALRAAGIGWDPMLIAHARPGREGGRAAVAQVLALPDPPTACLAYNDVVATGVVHGLTERGRAAGRDFAVVGFDDIAEARQMAPPLTTVAVNGEGLGERAARLLLRLIEQPGAKDEIVIGATQLVVRQSCGARLVAGAA
ncbi:MAG: LacI family DNA-binding transcriptional regulator [Rhodospirillales bacterium]|nr:LacI family DNA-binding transcriptional regulator [Rhodospirillales bacterium]